MLLLRCGPGQTRTGAYPFTRRALFPTELRGHALWPTVAFLLVRAVGCLFGNKKGTCQQGGHFVPSPVSRPFSLLDSRADIQFLTGSRTFMSSANEQSLLPGYLHILRSHAVEPNWNFGSGRMTARQSTNFYGDLRNALEDKVELGGFALSFGWNSIGMGKAHGFEIIEVLLVCHGRAHNDTICTVERKVKCRLA